MIQPQSSAKKVAVMAVTASLFATLFYISMIITVPNFTILYLPIILLGVFPLWFGLSGLTGSMIGAFIGGVLAENLGPLAWIESVTVLIIYGINWLLIPRYSREKSTKNLLIIFGIYSVSLLIGTAYILWQFTAVGILPPGLAEYLFPATYALNLVIELTICPILLRTVSPRLQDWGMYFGTFSDRKLALVQKKTEKK